MKIKRNYQERHGMSGTRIYKIWTHMIWRCSNENCQKYEDYGGRGISVCEEWLNSFVAFYNDMSESYRPNLEIDRKDNDGNYCKDNCRWVDRSTNAANTRKKVIGVGISKNKDCSTYRARISVDGVRYTIGSYPSRSEAILNYNLVHLEWYGVGCKKTIH